MMRTSGDKSSCDAIRVAHVEAIKLAISEGRYRIDPAAIADRMLAAARAEIQTRLNAR